MSPITTHILDTALGRPAANVEVTLENRDDQGTWQTLGKGKTDDDGRLKTLIQDASAFASGTYRLNFAIKSYLESQERKVFFPEVSLTFFVSNPDEHYHVPLLLSDFSYSTYRGS